MKDSPQTHKERHEALHDSLDELVADFVTHTQKIPSKASVLELIQWSYEQTQNPSEL